MLYVISAQTLLDNLKDNLYETNSSLLSKISIKEVSFSQLEQIIDLLVEKKLANTISRLYVNAPVPKQWENSLLLKALPKNIGQLTGLVHFSCCHHDVREIPEEIGYCSQLESLEFHNNDIYALPLTLGNCRYLKYVGLALNPYTIDTTLGLREIGYLPALHAEWHAFTMPHKTPYMALACRLPLELAHRIMLCILPRVRADLVAAGVEKSLTWLATSKPKKKLEAYTSKELENAINLPSQEEIQAYAQKHGIPTYRIRKF